MIAHCTTPLWDVVWSWYQKQRITSMKDLMVMNRIVLTEEGKTIVKAYLAELKAKRKEILDAHKDTADVNLPTEEDILADIEYYVDEDGDYVNNWGVIDNYSGDYPLSLHEGKDFIIQE